MLHCSYLRARQETFPNLVTIIFLTTFLTVSDSTMLFELHIYFDLKLLANSKKKI